MRQTTLSRQRTQVAAIAATADTPVLLRLTVFLLAILAIGGIFGSRVLALDSDNIRTAKALSNAYAEVVDHVAPAVVGIETEKIVKSARGGMNDLDFPREFFERMLPPEMRPRIPERRGRPDDGTRRSTGIGSGVVFDDQGHIITNNHVVADADNIKVEFAAEKGKTYKAEVVGRDPNSDIAVIKLVDPPAHLAVAALGNSDALKPGNIVIAIGSPLGFKQSVTTGVVSAKGRNLGELAYERFIQTDASINPGNSGGPLVNLDGEVVGLNTLISTSGGSGSIGIGFAIPINQAKSVVKQLIEKGTVTRGWLGIVMNPDDKDISLDLGHDGTGVVVTEIDASGPAAKAGVRRGDLIISFDNIAIKDNEHLRYLVAETNPGRDVPLVVLRDGDKVNLTLVIEPQPEDLYTNANRRRGGGGGGDLDDSDEVSSSLGLSVRNLDDAAREKYGIPESVTQGVVVSEVDSTGEAKDAGIRPGTVILEMDRLPVKDVAAFRKILKETNKDKILVYMRYGEVARYMSLKLK